MDNIIHTKNEVLKNLRNNINDLFSILSENRLINKINILSTVPESNVLNKIDSLIFQEILDNTTIYDLKTLILLFNEYLLENNVNMQINILNVIIDNYINHSLTLKEASTLTDILNTNIFNASINFKVLDKLVQYNMINYFEDHLECNMDSFVSSCILENDNFETIVRAKNLLIINNELKLNLNYGNLFSVINNALKNISKLDTSVLLELYLIYFIYNVNTVTLNKFNSEHCLTIEDSNLINNIKIYLEDDVFTENTLKDLLDRFTCLNKNLVYNVNEIKKQSSLRKQSDLKKQVVEVIHALYEKTNICPICNNELIKQDIWLAFYTDKTQEKYNGVIPANTWYCCNCNKHYMRKNLIKAMEVEVYPEVLFYN